jgi:hypothetical protein
MGRALIYMIIIIGTSGATRSLRFLTFFFEGNLRLFTVFLSNTVHVGGPASHHSQQKDQLFKPNLGYLLQH